MRLDNTPSNSESRMLSADELHARYIEAGTEKQELIDMLAEAKQQIEDLHDKFKPTGTGNSVLARINLLLERYE
jgi:hypothetical protein